MNPQMDKVKERIIDYLMSDEAPCICGLDNAKRIADWMIKFFGNLIEPMGEVEIEQTISDIVNVGVAQEQDTDTIIKNQVKALSGKVGIKGIDMDKITPRKEN